jgi:hypothetical protein
MKLVVCITVFDGLELLAPCIENYRKFVDDVVICYQTRSNTWRTDPTIIDSVTQFEDCHLIRFQPVREKMIKDNEMTKHDMMVNYAKGIGATHFIISAVDHFYNVDDVKNVREDAQAYDVTFTEVHTYYKNPTWQVDPMVPWKMPFICKMNANTHIKKVASYPLFVDPACKIAPLGKWKLYEDDEIVLHNYSNVRVNFAEKIKNADLPKHWSTNQKQEIVEQFERYDPSTKEPILYYNYTNNGCIIKEVPNYFNL